MNLAPIFGDGVSATLIEKTDFNEAFLSLEAMENILINSSFQKVR